MLKIQINFHSLSADKRNSSLEHSSWVDSLAYILTGAKSIVEKSIKVNHFLSIYLRRVERIQRISTL